MRNIPIFAVAGLAAIATSVAAIGQTHGEQPHGDQAHAGQTPVDQTHGDRTLAVQAPLQSHSEQQFGDGALSVCPPATIAFGSLCIPIPLPAGSISGTGSTLSPCFLVPGGGCFPVPMSGGGLCLPPSSQMDRLFAVQIVPLPAPAPAPTPNTREVAGIILPLPPAPPAPPSSGGGLMGFSGLVGNLLGGLIGGQTPLPGLQGGQGLGGLGGNNCLTSSQGGSSLLCGLAIPQSNGGYCRRTSDGSLAVRLAAFQAKPPMTVAVDFGNSPAVTNQATSPAIPRNGFVDVMVPIPAACFSPSCYFRIRALDPRGAVQASGSCIG
jgi:hypothetical protein